uniref:(northern house mosquito) hypothetical protein n=1 Tax=Culex pipiens TaxID=7175 RepID=A0A8D8CFB1_CULPI
MIYWKLGGKKEKNLLCHLTYNCWITFVICAKVNQRPETEQLGGCRVICWKIYSCQDKSPIFTGFANATSSHNPPRAGARINRNDTVPVLGISLPISDLEMHPSGFI